jgi:ferredoxin-NADP reductase
MLSPDVIHIITDKPAGYHFVPGQATDVALNERGKEKETRPFTFTGLATSGTLEFMIKCYDSHNGVKKEMRRRKPGDRLIIGDAWGAISFKGNGVFIAGGAGLTPFVAILRQLNAENHVAGNTLFFANRKKEDIFLEEELRAMKGLKCVFILSDEEAEGYHHGRIDKEFLAAHVDNFGQQFYICGPESFTSDITHALETLGAKPDQVIFEK